MPPALSRRPRTSTRPSPYSRKPRAVPAPPPAPKKSAWDKISVIVQAVAALAIIVPLIALYVSVRQFNTQQADNAATNLDQQRQATLSQYLDDMSSLVLQYKLPESKPADPVRAIAVARTVTAVRDLDGDRKGTLIRYLWEAGLISAPKPIVDIFGADLTGAHFNRADLDGVALSQLILNTSQFFRAQLVKADLSGSTLYESVLTGANLSHADLSDSDPIAANLAGANLTSANLTDSDLTGANLTDAILTGADLKGARYNSKLQYVTNPQGDVVLEGPTQWPRGFNPRAVGAFCYTC